MRHFKGAVLGACLLAGFVAAGPSGSAHAQSAATEKSRLDQVTQPRSSPVQSVQASERPVNVGAATGLSGPEQRVALVIGNSRYQNTVQLPNPANDTRAVAQLLNSAGFEVISATDLSHNQMIQAVQEFSSTIAGRGPNTVAMVYYAGHGVQLAGENYLVPVDARVTSEPDLIGGSLRLVDVMATLEEIPSRMRIVILDACRNNPFPSLNEAGRGLAIVDAPKGSIVGYSTAPGTEALDGAGDHSPYTAAFLRLAHEKNLPIEQLFKRIRLDVGNSTDGQQTPWESSSLTSDFYFFGDTAVAATRSPSQATVAHSATDLPSRSSRQAYEYVLAENSIENYQEFLQLYPRDPMCGRIRTLLSNLVQAKAWHNAVQANSTAAYKSFYENFSNSPYAQSALKMAAQPKLVPLSQPTQIIAPPSIKLGSLGISKDNPGRNPGVHGLLPGHETSPQGTAPQGGSPGKVGADKGGNAGQIVTLPSPGSTAHSGNNSAETGKVIHLPGNSLNDANARKPIFHGTTNQVEEQSTKSLPSMRPNQQSTGTSRPDIFTATKVRRETSIANVGNNQQFASSQFRAPAGQPRMGFKPIR